MHEWNGGRSSFTLVWPQFFCVRWSLKASLDWANEMTQNDGLMWVSHTEVRCGQSLQLLLQSCFSSITSICSVYSGECPGTAAFFFSTLSACLSIYVSPLLIFSVTLTVSLGSVNTVWESLWHYVHSISELKKHQQTLIPRQETPLQHKATSQSPAVKNGSAGICFSSSEFHSVLLQRLPLRNW